MPELTTSNEEKVTSGNEQKPKNRKLSIVKDNYKIHSSFDDDSDNVFTDATKKTNTKSGDDADDNEKRRLVIMQTNNQIKELQTIIWNR